MKTIRRYDVNEEWAHTGLVEAGDFYYLNYCVGNIGQDIESQIMVPLMKWNAVWGLLA